MRIGHNTVAAVRRQGRHPVLQREPSHLCIPGGGHDDQRPVTETLKRTSLRERRVQLGQFVAQAAVLTSRRVMETLHVSRWRGQTSKAGVKDQASHAESG